MKKILKWAGIALGGVATLVLCAIAYLFIASQWVVARTYDTPPGSFNAPSGRAAVREGERLARIYGCMNCHGEDLTGTDSFNKPGIVHITAPNLTSAVKNYSDSEFERLMRHGIKRDGRSAWIMPSAMFSQLTDSDLGAIAAYVRSFPETAGIEPLTEIQALGRVALLAGKLAPQVERLKEVPAVPAPNPDDPLSHGRYLVMTACTECHGTKLEGWDFIGAPNLAIAAAYDETDFTALMRHGTALGGRSSGLMSEVSRARFAHFTDAEIGAIRGYLHEFAQRGAAMLP